MPPAGYLAETADLCRERGALFMLDEVQTGLGRTGTLFAHQAEGIIPDVMTLSKALGAGLPLGAMLARGDGAKAFQPGTHASTFGGNPVACAAALALLDILLEEGFLEKTAALAGFFRTGLEEIAERRRVASSVRGRGMLLALELTVEAKPVVEAALAKGYLINAVQEKVLRFAPPFVIQEEQISGFLSALDDILAELD